jgi:hypothetical protein
MDDNEKAADRDRGSLSAWLVAVVVLLPAYVVSVGPCVWLIEHGYLRREVGLIYLPIFVVAHYITPMRSAVDWYLDLWR